MAKLNILSSEALNLSSDDPHKQKQIDHLQTSLNKLAKLKQIGIKDKRIDDMIIKLNKKQFKLAYTSKIYVPNNPNL